MWRDVCLYNKEALLASLDMFTERLNDLISAVEAEDGDALERIFITAKQTRDNKVLRQK